MNGAALPGWDRLRHGGLLLDAQRLQAVAQLEPPPLPLHHEQDLRRAAAATLSGDGDPGAFVAFVLEKVCGFAPGQGTWLRGPNLGGEWSRRTPTGESVKPRHLWRGEHGALLPLFLDAERQVGVGRGRRTASQVVQWLRAGSERLALLTNGRQWRLIFAGLDFDAWCEWDVDLWFEEGELSPQVRALRTLLSPRAWTPPAPDQSAPLLAAVLDSRKGQAELSAALGERVREAVELLVQAHGEVLRDRCADVAPADIYRAAVRVVMRLVVVLFAESRDLLPRDNALYHVAYGVGGLIDELEKVSARGGNRLARSWSAWPRLLALFRLVHQGSHHPALTVPAYGGELFAPAEAGATDGLARALRVFETAAFDPNRSVFSDREVRGVLERVSRTRVKLRQGRGSTWVTAPVDFSDLSSEYIGILYEGLLDFELKTVPGGDPVVFLAVGNQPALPLSRLEAMDDRALTALLEKMKDTSSAAEGGEDGEDAEGGEADEEVETPDGEEAEVQEAEAEESTEDHDAAGAADAADQRHVTRSRAEAWARRAVEVGRLTPRPRGTLTPEKRSAYEEAVSRKARQLVARVVLPGEWYLVRWGGTRKGSGTFYTRPGLAVPTVQRTLRPLAWVPPTKADGTPDADAPARDWVPKRPEEILALKVCDPACGSGTFPVAALRYLTEALFAAVHHHGRVVDRGDRSMVSLLGPRPADAAEFESLGQELVPCRPDDASFEARLKAVLKRYVVERCIYGVDLDPLAVELCRLALWIETMDRALPFSFLDHKVKCGNSLVGAWFDQFLHYPVMAWKGRKGGDDGFSNGVHFASGARSKAIKAFTDDRLVPEVQRLLQGRTLFEEGFQSDAARLHDEVFAEVVRLHELPVHDSVERARLYRDRVVGTPSYVRLKDALDLWCACWFWPADEVEHAPLPTRFTQPAERTVAVARAVAQRHRFFHWELEFPDVFYPRSRGFDAVLGNPPWDTLQPSSKEFFSNLDPLYRTYGKQEAVRKQTALFESAAVERDWLDYKAGFADYAHWTKHACSPFGDPRRASRPSERFRVSAGRADEAQHDQWREARARSGGYADPEHPYRYCGDGKPYTYKLFLELAYALLKEGGRLGFVVPSGIYSDDGATTLRRLLLDSCRWEWVFNFENRLAIFAIHRSFKFNPIVAQRGGRTDSVLIAVNRRDVDDWADGERFATRYSRSEIRAFSPSAGAFLEVESKRDLEVLGLIYERSMLLSNSERGSWGASYRQGDFNLTSASSIFRSAEAWVRAGARADGRCGWSRGDESALPLYEGKMIWQFDFSFSGYDYGGSRRWNELDWGHKRLSPRYLIPADQYPASPGVKLVIRDMSSPSNRRTLIAACVPDLPCGHKTPILRDALSPWKETLALVAVLNSFCFDYVTRARFAPSGGGGSLVWSVLGELPIWKNDQDRAFLVQILCDISLQLLGDWAVFAPVVAARARELGTAFSLQPAVSPRHRLELRCIADALNFYAYGLSLDDVRWVLRDCDHPLASLESRSFTQSLGTKLFWRVDRDVDPECRHTVLSVVAYQDLLARLADGGAPAAVIRDFALSPAGRWQLPERLTLSDYGLGRDARATAPQPVRERFAEAAAGHPDSFPDWASYTQVAAEHLYGQSWAGASSQEQELPAPLTDQPAQSDLFGRSHVQARGPGASRRVGRK
jgi:hypothetical protein